MCNYWRLAWAIPVLAAAMLTGCATNRGVTTARTDAVSDWMAMTAAHRVSLFARTVETARTDSMVALAMFEAANAIEQRYRSRLGLAPARDGVPVEAAVASAAAAVLSALYPEHAAVFTSALDDVQRGYRNDPLLSMATRLGERAADAAIRRGQQSMPQRRAPFRTTTPPGAYIPEGTPSLITDFDLALVPWALPQHDAVRAGPPPDLRSPQYARDLQEVARLGAAEGHARTAEQAQTARFWFLIDLNPILRQIAERPGRSAAQNARLYAMFYMAADDAWLAAGDAKVHYQFWRPITAIRAADRDGNAQTTRMPYWQPFMPTPPHPEYPCAHCVQAAAQAAVLAAESGDPLARFRFVSSTLPDAAPRMLTLSDYVRQTSMSRIYAGAHYRFSNEAGEAMGNAIGEAVLAAWAE